MDIFFDAIRVIDIANNLIIRFLRDSIYGGSAGSTIDGLVFHSFGTARYRGGWWQQLNSGLVIVADQPKQSKWTQQWGVQTYD